jgi:hypothetical protein
VSRSEWLLSELPGLVERGVLSAESAEALRRHYAAEASRRGGSEVARALVGVLGALFAGGGVTLLLAHNWDLLSRGARAGVLVAALLGAQAVAAFALLRRAGSAAWREAAGGLLVAAVVAAVSLVSQTYHLPGDAFDLLRLVLVLSIPVAYLLDSVAASALCWGLLVVLAGSGPWQHRHEAAFTLWWWGLALAGLPYLVLLARREGRAWRTAVATLCGAVALFAGGIFVANVSSWDGLGALHVLAIPAIAHALGSERGDAPEEAWRGRLRVPAYLALVAVGLVLSTGGPWDGMATGLEPPDAAAWSTLAVAVLAGGWATLLAVRQLGRGDLHLGLASGAWVVGAVAFVAAAAGAPGLSERLFDLWLVALGVAGLASGWREGRLARANAALLALGGLAVVRFFDTELSFLVRGVVFVLVGLAFLAVNLRLSRRRVAA